MGLVERLGVGADGGGVPVVDLLEAFHGGPDAFDGLLGEQHARLAVLDGLGGSAPVQGNHRRPAGHRLDGHQPEVFQGGENKRLRPPHAVGQGRVAHSAEEFDVARATGGLADLLLAGPVADHDQPTVRHFAEGSHDQVHPLVGHHAGGGEVGVALVGLQGEGARVDGRMQHRRLASVGLGDAAGDEVRDRDEAVHPGGRAAVPVAKAVEHDPRQAAFQAGVQPGPAKNLLLEVPGVSHGRVTQAEVQLVGGGPHALGHRVIVGDHHVVVGHVELFDGQGHQRKVAAVARPCAGEALDEGGFRAFALQQAALLVGQEIDHGKEVGVGEDFEHLGEDLLGPGVHRQPFVDDCDAH